MKNHSVSNYGFSLFDRQQQADVASKGGKAAHQIGEIQEGSRKGGRVNRHRSKVDAYEEEFA